MKSIFSVLLLTLFLSGCASVETSQSLLGSESEKQALIAKADAGDVQAMLDLHDIYLFPETEEGLAYYKKWYPLVLKSQDKDAVVALKKLLSKDISEGYLTLFVNGRKVDEGLTKAAADLGDKDSLYTLLIRDYNNRLESLDIDKLTIKHDEILANPTPETIATLYTFYVNNNMSTKADEVKAVMEQQGFPIPLISDFKALESLYQVNDPASLKRYFEPYLVSNNIDSLRSIISDLDIINQPKDRLMFVEKMLLLDKVTFADYGAYFRLYKKLRDNYPAVAEDSDRKILDKVKKAALDDNYQAAEMALNWIQEFSHKDSQTGSSNQDEWDKFEKALLKLNESKRALAGFKPEEESNAMLDELANKGNGEAMVTLAAMNPDYFPIHEESNQNEGIMDEEDEDRAAAAAYSNLMHARIVKWRDFIVNSGNPSLVSKLKQATTDTAFKTQLEEMELAQHNIYTLRERYRHSYGSNTALFKRDISLAIQYGDAKSAYRYADYLFRRDRDQSLQIYNDLVDQGSIKAAHTLAEYYEMSKDEKDIHKAINYYEKSFEFGDNKAARKLALLYLCEDNCSLGKTKLYNKEKATYYFDQLVAMDAEKTALTVAQLMYINVPEEASYYFEQLASIGMNESYAYLSSLAIGKDKKKAFEYMLKGAEKGDRNAIVRLIPFYEQGVGVERNMAKALEYYIKAYKAFQWKKIAQSQIAYSIGKIYQDGADGVPANEKRAIFWYKRSGEPEAIAELKKLQQ